MTRIAAAARKTTGLNPQSRLEPASPRPKRFTRSTRPSERPETGVGCPGLSERGGACSRLLCSLFASSRSIASDAFAMESHENGVPAIGCSARAGRLRRSYLYCCACCHCWSEAVKPPVVPLLPPFSRGGSLQGELALAAGDGNGTGCCGMCGHGRALLKFLSSKTRRGRGWGAVDMGTGHAWGPLKGRRECKRGHLGVEAEEGGGSVMVKLSAQLLDKRCTVGSCGKCRRPDQPASRAGVPWGP